MKKISVGTVAITAIVLLLVAFILLRFVLFPTEVKGFKPVNAMGYTDPTILFMEDFSDDLIKWHWSTTNSGIIEIDKSTQSLKMYHDGKANSSLYIDKRNFRYVTGEVIIEFRIKPESITRTQAFPHLKEVDGSGITYIFGLTPDGKIQARNASAYETVGSYTMGEWMNVKIVLNISSDEPSSYTLYINDEKLASVTNMIQGKNFKNLGEFRLVLSGGNDGKTQLVYIDDIKITKPDAVFTESEKQQKQLSDTPSAILREKMNGAIGMLVDSQYIYANNVRKMMGFVTQPVTPVLKDGVIMAPLGILAENLGMQYSMPTANIDGVFRLDDNTLKVKLNDNIWVINDKEKKVTTPVQVIGGALSVPVVDFAKAFGKEVFVYEGKLAVISDKKNLFNSNRDKELIEMLTDIIQFEKGEQKEPVKVSIEKIGDTIIDPEGLNFEEGTYGLYPNGLGQDTLITFNNYQYAAYYNGNRHVCVARRKLSPESEWDTIELKDYDYKTNDTHNYVSMGICRNDGTIHLAFDHHNEDLHYRVSKQGVATNPDETEWTADIFGPVKSELVARQKETVLTYPRFINTPDGNLQFIKRKGISGNGFKSIFTYDGKDTHQWTEVGEILSRYGNYQGMTLRSPYLAYPQYFDNKLFFTWVWREVPSGSVMRNRDLYFAYSEDYGATWKNNSGDVIAKADENPMDTSTEGLRVAEIGLNHALGNNANMYVDSMGRVHVITQHAPETRPEYPNEQEANAFNKYVHYWRDTNGVWNQYRLDNLPRGSWTFRFLMDENNTAYIIYAGNNSKLTIAVATEAAEWKDWKVIYTEDSIAKIEGPNVDFQRWQDEGILSVFAQEVPDSVGAPSKIHCIDLKVNVN